MFPQPPFAVLTKRKLLCQKFVQSSSCPSAESHIIKIYLLPHSKTCKYSSFFPPNFHMWIKLFLFSLFRVNQTLFDLVFLMLNSLCGRNRDNEKLSYIWMLHQFSNCKLVDPGGRSMFLFLILTHSFYLKMDDQLEHKVNISYKI